MNKKAKRSFAVSLSVTLGIVIITAAAFFPSCVKAETDPLDNNGAGGSSSSAVSGNNSSSRNSSSDNSEPAQPKQSKVTLNFNGGTGGDTTVYVPSGTTVGELATPVKKGYRFAGWVSGGNDIMSGYKINDNISLMAQWEKAENGSSQNSRGKTSSKTKSSSNTPPIDTHQSEVNDAASNAEAAVSDPDALSSQDWSGVFSSGGNSSQASQGAAGLLSSENGNNSSGGNSWLFIAGIALIVLAACGIGLFIYLQFFRTPRSGGPRNKGMGDDMDDTEEIDSFTDISSDSSGTQQRNDLGDNENENTKPIIMSDSAVKSEILRNVKPHSSAPGVSRQAPPAQAAPKAQAAQKAQVVPKTQAAPRAQAKPVNGSKSDFDWDKFFNDDNI